MSKVRYKRPKRIRPGRKVYRTRSLSGQKSRNANSTLKVVLGAAGLAVLVFVGYSIGAPIQKFLSEKKADKNDNAITQGDDDYDDLLPHTVTTLMFDNIEETPPETAEADIPENTANIPPLSEIKAAAVSLSAMGSVNSLDDELKRIKSEGFNAAVFTLKDKGGDIYFNIKSPFASFAGGDNIKSDLFADEISGAAEKHGLYPIARINLFEDYHSYSENCYGTYKDANGNVWKNKDGHSILSPYDENTLDFIGDIAKETAEGGFDYIIISGDEFPDFTMSDYNMLGEALAFGDRYGALVKAANIVYRNADKCGCGVILEVSAAELAAGRAEAVRPDELMFDNICAVYENDEHYSGLTSNARGMNIIPAYSAEPSENTWNYIRY